MKTIQLIITALLGALMLNPVASQADDIDIYSGLTGSSNAPNLMFVIDSAANSDGSFGATACTYYDGSSPSLSGTAVLGNEQCALVNIVHNFPTNSNGSAQVKLGITTANGLLLPLVPIDDNPYNGGAATTLTDKASSVTIPAGTTNRQAFILAAKNYAKRTGTTVQSNEMQETWAYYTGGNAGTLGTANNVGSITGKVFAAGAGVAATACQKNYILTIGASPASAHSNTVTDGPAPKDLATAVANDGVNINPATGYPYLTPAQQTAYLAAISGNTEVPYTVEWARYMYQTDVDRSASGTQNIISYAVILEGGNAGMDTFWQDVALYGGGKSFKVTDYTSIYNDILKILNEVQAVNSVFASSSLPVSVNAQGTFLNQIFMGMFRPDASGQPRWVGNLKQYQFCFDTATQVLSLCDSTGGPAISGAGTGFISANALSFWTQQNLLVEPDLGGGFWRNRPQGVGAGYDSPDGEIVEKGGSAQTMRLANLWDNYNAIPGSSTNPRNLYTCPSGTACGGGSGTLLSAALFDTSNAALTNAVLGTGSRAITSIFTAATATPTSTVAVSYSPGISATPAVISIISFTKSGSTVTATVSASDLALISPTSQITVTGISSKVNCTSCAITITSTTTFTYTSGSGSLATSSFPASISNPYSVVPYSVVTVNSTGHGLAVGQNITFASTTSTTPCTVLAALNNTIQTITSTTANSFTIVQSPSALAGTDFACKYSPNTATVTTSTAHGYPSGQVVVNIAGATPAGYNGAWSIIVTTATQFTYQYTSPAPLTSPATLSSATVTSTSTTRDALTKWVRGDDTIGDEASPDITHTKINVRPSVHGDVLHSRPTVINYGGAIGVVVYYGVNDGVFRAVNGNQTAAIGSVPPGGELWGLVLPEQTGSLLRMYDNSPLLMLSNTPTGIVPTPQRKNYFVDGITGLYQKILADGTTAQAYLFLSMRRGGNMIYALDVTDPVNPKFMWKINNTMADFTELGQTWSQPKVAFVEGYTNPVLVFGGGYDTSEDGDAGNPSNFDITPPGPDTSGRGIFIVDAVTGALVWKATYGATTAATTGTTTKASATDARMIYSIPSDLYMADLDFDGYTDRLYVGDVGGNIWRVDLAPTAGNTPNFWKLTQLAALGCHTGPCAAGTTPRKFFYPPDVVPLGLQYDAVLIGSGDREHPLYSTASNSAYSTTNRFYMVKDPDAGPDGSNPSYLETDLVDNTNTAYSATACGSGASNTYNGSGHGYYVTLGTGEKVVNGALTVAGWTYFGTNTPATPSSNSCTTNLGTAKGYAIQPLAGTSNCIIYNGGGLPPSPVAGAVNILVNDVNQVMPFCIGCGGNPTCVGSACASALSPGRPNIYVSGSRKRTFWYKEND